MSEKLALKKALFDELKRTNQFIEDWKNLKTDEPDEYLVDVAKIHLAELQSHKDFIQHLIDICVDRNKF